SEESVFRAAQFANFTTPMLLDDDDHLAAALEDLSGIDARALVARIDAPDVRGPYEPAKAAPRSAAGSAAELQGKTRITDGPVRFTAPSVAFEQGGQSLIAGGFQPVEAYVFLVANLDPGLDRLKPPDTPEPLLDVFPDGL